MIKVFGNGRLTIKPELRTVTVNNEEQHVCTLNVASNRLGREKPDYIQIEVWNTMADNCVKYLDKGSSISFEGDYETTQYKKDNVTVTNVKVVKATIEFTDRKPQTEQ